MIKSIKYVYIYFMIYRISGRLFGETTIELKIIKRKKKIKFKLEKK